MSAIQPTAKRTDPLLAVSKVLVIIVQIIMIFGMVMLAIGIGAIVTVGRADLAAEIAASGAPAYGLWLIVLAMLTGIVLLGMAWRFLNELRGIINSVDEGDPFRHDNADRLNLMGWIGVAGHLIIMPIAILAMWFEPYFDKAGKDVKIDGAFDLGSILLTLILFILARVFRRGAEMRDELEGTV
jgi:Protein of unknown function (DUF2975)